jgi:hypothetical protein
LRLGRLPCRGGLLFGLLLRSRLLFSRRLGRLLRGGLLFGLLLRSGLLFGRLLRGGLLFGLLLRCGLLFGLLLRSGLLFGRLLGRLLRGGLLFGLLRRSGLLFGLLLGRLLRGGLLGRRRGRLLWRRFDLDLLRPAETHRSLPLGPAIVAHADKHDGCRHSRADIKSKRFHCHCVRYLRDDAGIAERTNRPRQPDCPDPSSYR